MFKQIKLRGISRTPSDRGTADGGCAESLNVYLDGNETAPVLEPELVTKYGALAFEGRPVFIHKGPTYENIIMYVSSGNGSLKARRKGMEITDASISVCSFQSGEKLKDITAVGNTLIVLTNKRTEYVLYKIDEDVYQDLGDRIPVPNVEFVAMRGYYLNSASGSSTTRVSRATDLLKRSLVINDSYTFSSSPQSDDPSARRRTQFDNTMYGRMGFEQAEDENGLEFTERAEKELRNMLWEEVKAGINVVKKNGSALCPVFVRSALRLYDGSYIYQSVPVLLGADRKEFFTAYVKATQTNNTWKSSLEIDFESCFKPLALLHSYSYQGWEDIISSIDLFMSTDVHNPALNGEWANIQEVSISDEKDFNILFKGEDAEKDMENLLTEVLSKSVFYKVASFAPKKFASLTLGYNLLTDDKFKSQDYLVVQQTLPDDYQSFHKKRADKSFQYNNKLIITGLDTEIYPGYPFLNGQTMLSSGGYTTPPEINLNAIKVVYEFKFYLRDKSNRSVTILDKNISNTNVIEPYTAQTPYIIRTQSGGVWTETTTYVTEYARSYSWLAYPDARCRRVDMRIKQYDGDTLLNTYMRTYEMTPHPSLNCAYVFVGLGMTLGYQFGDDPNIGGEALTAWDDTENKTYTESNVLWASLMNNPFVFPAEGKLTFSAEVLALAVATKALSEGQYGQYPLTVFTRDGMWSIPITSDGDFAACVPLSKDVLSSPDAVIGIEQAVVFVTNQGVMMLSGSDITPLSPNMNGEHFVPDASLKTLLAADSNLGDYYAGYSDNMDFVKFVSNGNIAYDYTNRRLIFFREDKGYQYVYYLASGTWHKMCFSKDEWIEGKINSYPDCYLASRKLNILISRNPCQSYATMFARLGDEVLSSRMAGNILLNVGQNEPVINENAEIIVTPGLVHDNSGNLIPGAEVKYICTVIELIGQPYHYSHDLYVTGGSNYINGYCDVNIKINGTAANGMTLNEEKTIRLYLTDDYSQTREVSGAYHFLYDFSVVFDSSRQVPTTVISHDEQKALPGLIITRPMAFDLDDIRKVMKKVSIRGKRNKDDVKYLLYGSMDGLSWMRLRSLHGGSYKWFRMVMLVNMSPAERISWVDVELDTRLTNRLR